MLKPFSTAKLFIKILKQSFHEKRAKSLEKFFLQLWKSDFDDFLQIAGNKFIYNILLQGSLNIVPM